MDHRVVIAVAVALALIAVGGFYFAFSPRAPEAIAPVVRTSAGVPKAQLPTPSGERTASSPAAPVAPAAPPAPEKATPESVEAEIARSDHAELQVLLKRSFPDEYRQLIEVAVRRRNEGASETTVGQETFLKFQELMRSKLKFASAADMATIDKLAANEIDLFHALGSTGARYCLAVLGRAETSEPVQPSEDIRKLMRQATLYRFQAIGEGMPRFAPIAPLTPTELAAFEASLARDGLSLDEVRSGAFLSKEGDEPGKPCRMVEKLYRAVARLDDGARRKLFSSMFFLGRDR
jgi:hypothetical protein